ncbi:MAG TPA: hypothetical protein VK875_11455 [Euzebyales bacterium]|nr:hypothetical protein [Euzebyales bacterium]
MLLRADAAAADGDEVGDRLERDARVAAAGPDRTRAVPFAS